MPRGLRPRGTRGRPARPAGRGRGAGQGDPGGLRPAPPSLGSLSPASRDCWARTRLLVWPERYHVASLPPTLAPAAAALVAGPAPGPFAALVLERDEVSVTVEESAWAASPLRARALADAGPYRVITFDLDLDLSVVGYLAPAAERLARSGVSILPQCAYRKDHLLVRDDQLAPALAALEQLVAEAQAQAS